MSLVINANAKLKQRIALELLVANFYAAGNTVTTATALVGKKPKTFRSSQGAWGKGRKAVTLRNSGFARAKG